MAPSTTLWALPPQTVGKHLVLRSYLGAWLGILGPSVPKLVLIDGYAGPGEYKGHEWGSPLIALNVFESHSARDRIVATPMFLFLEENPKRYAHLKSLVAPIALRLGRRARVDVETGRFDASMSDLLDAIEADGFQLAPTFVMVDPFGVSHLPMALMGRILKNPKAEVFISFMFESIKRHRGTPEFEPHLDELFGCRNWRDMDRVAGVETRKKFVLDLYETQLRAVGAKYVTRFELWDGGRFIYAIYFATSNALGCDRMKQAIWSADPSGSYQFRGGRESQILLFGPDFQILEQELRDAFGGEEVGVDELDSWVRTDKTQFHSGHLRKALKSMEIDGSLSVRAGTRTRKKTFPNGTRLTIAPVK